MALHWTALIGIAGWLFDAVPGWLLALHALGWGAVSAVWGMRAGPSPALKPPAIRQAAWLGQIGLLALYAIGALLAAFDVAGARPVLLVVIAVASLHGVFNLWRATVLGDGALRRITPRAFH